MKRTMRLYRCDTIEQFKIGMWLAEQGITCEDVESVELVDRSTVKVVNTAGQYIVIRWSCGRAEIDREMESGEGAGCLRS